MRVGINSKGPAGGGVVAARALFRSHSSTQATTLKSQLIQGIQIVPGQTLRASGYMSLTTPIAYLRISGLRRVLRQPSPHHWAAAAPAASYQPNCTIYSVWRNGICSLIRHRNFPEVAANWKSNRIGQAIIAIPITASIKSARAPNGTRSHASISVWTSLTRGSTLRTKALASMRRTVRGPPLGSSTIRAYGQRYSAGSAIFIRDRHVHERNAMR